MRKETEMSNKSDGNKFEKELCNILYEDYGFWVHNMLSSRSGQPADIIAVKRGKAFLIDSKVCENGKFSKSRIEPNQHCAMELWKACNEQEGWFALKIGEEIIMIDYRTILKYKKFTLTAKDIFNVGYKLRRWVDCVNYGFK